MKFFKELRPQPTPEITNDNRPTTDRLGPDLKNQARSEIGDRLATLDVVAQTLGISKRSVQRLVKRKVIPVIRLGKRCPRFDMNRVWAAVKRFEVEEMTLR
jgi:excisionase family DNA binding protein